MFAPSHRILATSALVGFALLAGCSGAGDQTDPGPTNRTVNVTATGTGGGTVTSSPAGISCGVTCSAMLSVSSAVVLTAAPNATSAFTGWSGACTGSSTTCTIAAGSNAASATATFELVQHLFTVILAGTGTGTVTSSPAGITCGTDCTEGYTSGTAVTLTATAAASSTFAGWTGGGCATATTCVVTITQAANVTATFTLTTPTLTVALAGTGTGTVTSSPAGIACAGDCSEPYNYGTSVTLTVTPSISSTFTGWSGGGCTGTGTCVVVVTQTSTITATFALKTNVLTVMRAGVGSGTVSSTPAGISCGVTCAGSYTYGTTVTLTASADATSTFTGWGGACTGTAACVVAMNGPVTATATFGAVARRWPDSGTRTCTNLTSFVACPGGPVGQDGFYAINVPAYEVIGGTVRDPITGFVWERSPPITGLTQAAALTYCDGLMLDTFTDWRLPSALELLSIVDFGRVGTPFTPSAFTGIPPNSYIWTSTDWAADPSKALSVNTNYAISRENVKVNASDRLVRCVRGTAYAGVVSLVGGTVLDGRTGLGWQSNVSPTDLTWPNALAYCEALVLDGSDDWRLPSGKELFSIVDVTLTSPTISPLFAMRPATPFWTSSVVANTAGSAYSVHFGTGISYGIDIPFGNALSVRCVRGG